MKLIISSFLIVLAVGSSTAALLIPSLDPNASLVPNVSKCMSLCRNKLIYGESCPFGDWFLVPGYNCKPGFCRLIVGGICLPLSPTTTTTTTTTTKAPTKPEEPKPEEPKPEEPKPEEPKPEEPKPEEPTAEEPATEEPADPPANDAPVERR